MAVYTGTNNCGDVRQVPMTKKAASRAALVDKQHKRTNKQTNNNAAELLDAVTSNEYVLSTL